MTPEVFNKFNSFFGFLPKFHVTITTGSNKEISPKLNKSNLDMYNDVANPVLRGPPSAICVHLKYKLFRILSLGRT